MVHEDRVLLPVDQDLNLSDRGKFGQGIDDGINRHFRLNGKSIGEECLIKGNRADIVTGEDIDHLCLRIDRRIVEITLWSLDDLLRNQSLHGNISVINNRPVGVHQLFSVLGREIKVHLGPLIVEHLTAGVIDELV